ncbi:MAG TPA: hypothetical protein VNE63_09300 [Candidatus Acidoferrales bacterium]|nr:hypothetical protein [Candidatus Acidoferrales bacterium]
MWLVERYLPLDQLLAGLFVLLLLALAWCRPEFGGRALAPLEIFGSRLARFKRRAVLSIAAAAILLRLSLLWAIPVPTPAIHDEFSYLLAADTFAHGRLTNPPHPMWLYFDTFHVNQHPAYMSKYPPAQGTVLALGQILGNPWIGVLLSTAAMCAAVVWMLQGWLPPSWALLGGVLVLLRFAIFGYWINSYWGGAIAAVGGALVVGALPRILRSRRPRDAIILGFGVAILANSRPFEGLVLCLPVAAVLLGWFFRSQTPSWRETLPRVVAPLCLVLLLCGIFMGYYNWRGTGNPFLFPYTVNDRTYAAPSALLWDKTPTPIHYQNPQFEAFYNGWYRTCWWAEGRADSIGHAARILALDAGRFIRFFMWPELCVPLLAFFWVLRDRRVRFLVVQAALCFVGFLLVAWFLPHYAAPVLATAFALTTQGIRHLRKWQYRGRPVGIGFSRAIVLSAIVLAPWHAVNLPKPHVAARAQVAAQLREMPGQQLVIVRYSAQHDPSAEWVYNRANIDRAKIVWARDIPGVSLSPLLRYFHDRHVWLIDADSSFPKPIPYPGQP